MVWPFSVEQRSHQPLGLAPEGSDIAHTLGQISEKPEITLVPASAAETDELVERFVAQRPNNIYIIDGEKTANESIICTSNEQGDKTCLHLFYNSMSLFKQMQKLEYFCSLPNDIDATYFECRKIA